MARPPSVRIELFGGFRLLDGQRRSRLPTIRQQEVIAFLILFAQTAPLSRQRVAGSIWPDTTDAQALTNLRRELHHLRDDWPPLDRLIAAGARTLAWNHTAASVDVFDFERAADAGLAGDRGALQTAASCYQGDLLAGCGADWIREDRSRLRTKAQRVLTNLADLLEQEGAFGQAIPMADRLLRLDPLDEHPWRVLMRCHARRGQRATALHLYQECVALLRKELGIAPGAQTRRVYQEIVDGDGADRVLPPAPTASVYPLIGRAQDWRRLLGAWTAAAGGPRLALVRGEAGIGKTRLTEELADWCATNSVRVATTRCYAGDGRLAYAPIAHWLRSDAIQSPFEQLNAATLAEPDPSLERWQRMRLFESIARLFRSAAPIVLIIDDLQWADGDTIECLQYCLRRVDPPARCLIVGAVRTEEEVDNPALGRLLHYLEREDLVTAISLAPLDAAATAELAVAVAGHALDEMTTARTFRETEGHPLFIVERGRMDETPVAGRATLAHPRVQAVVAARLALLSDAGRRVADVAATIGRDFQFDVLAQSAELDENTLVQALDELWRRQVVRPQSGDRWDFTHDRLREVAYDSIGPARRRLIHRRIAQVLERQNGTDPGGVSASIASHFDLGGLPQRAIPFFERAGAVAAQVSANEEAVRCFSHALRLLAHMPGGHERDAQELAIRSQLSVVLNVARGYAAIEVEENLERVIHLSTAGGGRLPVRWLWAGFSLRYVRGDLRATRVFAEHALERSVADPSCRCEAHHAMGATLLSLGELQESRRHFEAALAAYDELAPSRSPLGSDLGVFSHAWFAHTLWLLGESDAASQHAERAVLKARDRGHAYSETLALAYQALLQQMRGEADRVVESATAVVNHCERYGFGYYGDWARVLLGWATSHAEPAHGTNAIEGALGRLDEQRAQARRPYFLSLLADAQSRLGDHARASATLDSAIGMSLDRHDTWWLPALYLQRSAYAGGADRDATLARGLALCRTQGSRAFERHFLNALGSG